MKVADNCHVNLDPSPPTEKQESMAGDLASFAKAALNDYRTT